MVDPATEPEPFIIFGSGLTTRLTRNVKKFIYLFKTSTATANSQRVTASIDQLRSVVKNKNKTPETA